MWVDLTSGCLNCIQILIFWRESHLYQSRSVLPSIPVCRHILQNPRCHRRSVPASRSHRLRKRNNMTVPCMIIVNNRTTGGGVMPGVQGYWLVHYTWNILDWIIRRYKSVDIRFKWRMLIKTPNVHQWQFQMYCGSLDGEPGAKHSWLIFGLFLQPWWKV